VKVGKLEGWKICGFLAERQCATPFEAVPRPPRYRAPVALGVWRGALLKKSRPAPSSTSFRAARHSAQHVIPRSTSFRQHVSEGGAGFLRVGGAVGGLHDLAHEETQQFGLALAVARGLLGMLLRDLAGSVT